ncbi:MAG: hypothetical protein QNJ09_03850 [Paracoccaceae bacterium]|nr:hypothetical protein [Paracoccaceae bacterium]
MALTNDTFTFSGSIDDYDIVKTGPDTWTVAGIDPALGVETLTGVAFIQFDDTGPLDITQFTDTVGQTEATAVTLEVGQSITSTIDSDGDLDFFAINADGLGRYLVTIEGVSTGGGTLENPVGEFGIIPDFSAPEFGFFPGELFTNRENNELFFPGAPADPLNEAFDFSGRGFGTNAAFELNRESFGGQGFISVGSLGGLGTGTYTITLEELAFDQGEIVTVDEPHTASLAHGLDTDITLVNLEAGKHYVIEVEGAADSATPMGDAQISFGARDSDVPEFFRSDEARAPGESTQMVVTGNLDGRHFIRVRSASGEDPGDYTLTVTEIEDDFGTTRSTMGVLDRGETLSGSMDLLSDIDAFTAQDNGSFPSSNGRYAARVDAVGDTGAPYGQFEIEAGHFDSFRADDGGGTTDDIFVGSGQAATDFVTFEQIDLGNGFSASPRAFAVRLADDVNTELDYTVTFLESTDTADEAANFIELSETGAPQVLDGLGGDDILIGAATDDDISGGTGRDIISGGAGNDSLTGGQDADRLDGGAGNDEIDGGAGNDFILGGEGSDILDGGAGVDTATYAGSAAGVTVGLDGSAGTGGDAEGDLLFNIENLIGSGFDDRLEGDGGANRLLGGAGNDTLSGGAGFDVFVLQNGGGQNTITDYTVQVLPENFEATPLLGSPMFAGDVLDVSGLTPQQREAMTFTADGAGNTVITLTDGTAYTLLGNPEHIVLTATEANGDQSTKVLTNTGQSVLDVLITADGNASVVYFDDNGVRTKAVTEDFGDTQDFTTKTETFDAAGGLVSETIDFDDGSSTTTTFVDGQPAQRVVTEADGTVRAFTLITGTDGDDSLVGGNDSNLLDGGAGDDTLDGGTGDDTLSGGAGADQFVLRADGAQNTITDYNPAEGDVLDGSSLTDAQWDTATVAPDASGALRLTLEDGTTYTLEGNTGFVVSLAEGRSAEVVSNDLGDITTTTFAADGVRQKVVFEDISDSANFTTQTQTFDAAGDLVTETFDFDDGGRETTTFEGGEQVQLEIIAPDGTVRTFDFVTGTVTEESPNTGTDGDDNLVGSDGDDTLDGGDGDDTLDGGLGDDTINGGAGDDEIEGGAGDDDIDGGEGNDFVLGEDGDDEMRGGSGDDILHGGDGNDRLASSQGNDQQFGGAGDDIFGYFLDTSHGLFGGEGTDTLDMSSRSTHDLTDDTIESIEVLEVFDVGDRVEVTLTAAQLLDFEVISLFQFEDTDTLQFNVVGDDTDEIDLSGLNITGTPDIVRFDVIGSAEAETITGTSFDDTIDGGSGNDILLGGEGGDFMQGGDGADGLSGGLDNDSLLGDAGNDTLNGGNGADEMRGGTGDDTYTIDDAGDVVVENAGAGTDHINASISYEMWRQSQHTESLTLTGNADINGTGNGQDNTITGNSGNNVLNGANGNDTLIGGAGNDTLNGGNGADEMRGGTGDDTYTINDAGDVVVENAAEGSDHINASITYEMWRQSQHTESLTLTGTADINGTGNGQDNTITGNSGNNVLNGANGNDTLIGRAGNDTLNGGAGSDEFVFADGFGNDTISSFDATDNDEVINLAGVTSITSWTDLSNPANGHLYANAAGNVVIDDLAGNTITLTGVSVTDLGADDFLF